MKKIILTMIFSLFYIVSASAGPGINIGLSGNLGVFHGEATENENGDIDRDDATGVVGYGSVFIEKTLGERLAIGVDYVPMDFETPENVSQEDESNSRTVSARIDDLTTVYAKLNVPLGGTYLKVGYSQADVTSKENGGSGNSYGNDTTSGLTVGLGYNHEVANGLAVRLEVTGTDFSDVQVNNGQTNKTEITVKDIIGARGTLSIVKSF